VKVLVQVQVQVQVQGQVRVLVQVQWQAKVQVQTISSLFQSVSSSVSLSHLLHTVAHLARVPLGSHRNTASTTSSDMELKRSLPPAGGRRGRERRR